jgi:hypothetical protein
MRREPWVGSSAELERRLTDDNCAYRNDAKRLFNWRDACGTFLGKAAKSKVEFVAGRVSSRVLRGKTVWTITPPLRDEPEPEPTPVPTTRNLPPVPIVSENRGLR